MVRGFTAAAVTACLVALSSLFATPASAQMSGISNGWAGYADTGETFTSVSATWVQPALKCKPKTTLIFQAGFMVGLDGWEAGNEEMAGVQPTCAKGAATYQTLWEMPQGIGLGASMDAGDQITASVAWNGTAFVLSLTDAENERASFSVTESCFQNVKCPRASAEVAATDSRSGAVPPSYRLANFGAMKARNISVSDAAATGGIAAFDYTAVTMVGSGDVVKARPAPLGAAGGFNVRWYAAD